MGTLHSVDEGSSFNYEPVWRSLPWVSLTMPPRARSWLWARGLHPVFDMNLPEGYLLETLRSFSLKQYGRQDDLFLLGILAGSVRGRIEYKSPWFEDWGGFDAGAEKPGDMRLADVLESQDPDLFKRLIEGLLTRSFVSGVQPKVLARLFEKSTFVPRDFIVKTWGDECPYLADNEFLCMTAAKRAGIPVPRFYLSADSRFFVVERFDIDSYGHSLGFEELCALEGKNRSGKYSGSYENAAKTIATFVTEDARVSSLESFFAMLVLSVLVRNGNAHLKNFGILCDPENGSRGLAPCYDVVTTVAYSPKECTALPFFGQRFWPNRKQLVDFGVCACNLERKRAFEIWDTCAQSVADTRQAILEHIKRQPGFKDVAERMLVAWNAGLGDRS